MIMNQPSIDVLREKMDSRYTLVVAAAKRARQLLEGAPRLVDVPSDKPVTIALWEIGEDKLEVERTKSGIK
ncbi:MAG: DNA-directed RNA polymerase subunit omega [Limnochordales bacterium]|nr:DNA-directed RNA polymerase subunit omega [Limnochordales bacterium]